MTQLYEELIDVLEKEFTLCSQLVQLLLKEKDVIVSLDPKALEELVAEKETISVHINTCDKAREEILERLGFKSKTMSEIAAVAADEYKDTLTGLAAKFASVIQRISELNRFNGRLIEKSLYYIRASSHFLNALGVSPRQRVSVEA